MLSEGFKRAIEACGSKSELARKLSISAAAVSEWHEIPVRRVIQISRITGIPCHELRPEYFPAPENSP